MEKIRAGKKIPAKYQASIYTFKKEFLFKNIYNKYSNNWEKVMMNAENKVFYQNKQNLEAGEGVEVEMEEFPENFYRESAKNKNIKLNFDVQNVSNPSQNIVFYQKKDEGQ